MMRVTCSWYQTTSTPPGTATAAGADALIAVESVHTRPRVRPPGATERSKIRRRTAVAAYPMEPFLSAADCRDTVTSVRRPAVPILIALLMLAAALLPGPAAAHSARPGVTLLAATASAAGAPAPVALVGAQPAGPSLPWVLVALAAAVLLAMVRPGWRRAVGVTLVVLLTVLAVEQSVHSVHHLTAPTRTACVVAAAAGHLSAIEDGGAPMLPAPVLAPRALAELAPSHPLGVEVGPDPARAPPLVIA
jgi:hypothetical protein